MMNGWLRNHERPGPCLPLLACFKASSAWQLTKARSQNIINYKLNLIWAEIKHAHQLFKLGSLKSSLRCLAGLRPATCVPAAGGSQCVARGSFQIPKKQGPSAGSIPVVLPFLQIKKPFLPAKRMLSAGGDGLVKLNTTSTTFTLRNTKPPQYWKEWPQYVLLKNLSEGKVSFVMAFSHLSPGDFDFC